MIQQGQRRPLIIADALDKIKHLLNRLLQLFRFRFDWRRSNLFRRDDNRTRNDIGAIYTGGFLAMGPLLPAVFQKRPPTRQSPVHHQDQRKAYREHQRDKHKHDQQNDRAGGIDAGGQKICQKPPRQSSSFPNRFAKPRHCAELQGDKPVEREQKTSKSRYPQPSKMDLPASEIVPRQGERPQGQQ